MNLEQPRQIPTEVLARPVRGTNLKHATLGECLGQGPTLLVFLRHFG